MRQVNQGQMWSVQSCRQQETGLELKIYLNDTGVLCLKIPTWFPQGKCAKGRISTWEEGNPDIMS